VFGMTLGEALALDGGSERMPMGERSYESTDGTFWSWTRKINGTRYFFMVESDGRVEVDMWSSRRGWVPVHRWG
jgi:hypothetical protein